VCRSEMASTSLRFEDRLDGASNFLSWKVRVTLLLEENDLWDIVKDAVTPPIDPQQLVTHNKEVKAKQMIMDAIKYHLILTYPRRILLRRCSMHW
jgi:hypothetical protein